MMRRVVDDDRGLTLLELLVALGVIAVLMAIALPLFIGQQNQARNATAQSELRNVLVPLRTHLADEPRSSDLEAGVLALAPTTRFDEAAVLGVRLDRAADGATCMWRISASGAVFGVWEPAPGDYGQALYVERSSLPASCPATAETASAGFVSSGW